MKHSAHVSGHPVPKERPRVVKGRAFTPKRTLDWEAVVAAAWRESGGECLDGPVEVTIELSKEGATVTVSSIGGSSKLRGDVDNYAKSILDGLNGVAFSDDSKVLRLVVVKA